MAKSSTSFKKGNQIAVGNPNSGRPKEHDPIIEAAALIEWCKTPEATVLREFAPLRGYAPSLMDGWLKTSPVFLGAYALAKAMIGVRREKMLIDAGSSKPFERYADFYDDALLAHEQSKTVFDTTVKSKLETESKISPQVLEAFETFMDMMTKAQSDALNKAATSNNTESKS